MPKEVHIVTDCEARIMGVYLHRSSAEIYATKLNEQKYGNADWYVKTHKLLESCEYGN